MTCVECGAKTENGFDGVPLIYCSRCQIIADKNSFIEKQKTEKANNISFGEVENTFKFRTVIFLILGLIIPLWIITLPVFWFLAYRSYKEGDSSVSMTSSKYTYDDLRKLKVLLDTGVLTQTEFEIEKKKILGNT